MDRYLTWRADGYRFNGRVSSRSCGVWAGRRIHSLGRVLGDWLFLRHMKNLFRKLREPNVMVGVSMLTIFSLLCATGNYEGAIAAGIITVFFAILFFDC